MELSSNSWHVISAVLVFALGVAISMTACKAFSTSTKRSLALYMWHTLLCLVYIYYVAKNGGDAITYYRISLSGSVDFSIGTPAVEFITAFFSSTLGLSLLGTFLGFNIFGYIGLLAFDASLQSATSLKSRKVKRFATLIVFLPSVSFWSSAIGKDAWSFMAAGLFLWAVQDLKRRLFLMILATALMFLVRPHVAALMVVATAVSMVIEPRVSTVQRVALGITAIGTAVLIVPFAMSYSGLAGDTEAAAVTRFVELRQGYNMSGGGGVDISSMSLPMKMFTYLFRPLPFEAHNIPSLAASIDNVILLILVSYGVRHMIRYGQQSATANTIILWIYSLAVWLSLAMTTSNLGISVRQKWMFTPMLVFLFISAIGKRKQRASGFWLKKTPAS